MRQHTIAILLLVCAFALASFAQDQTVPAQNSQMPAAQTQTTTDQSVPSQTTTQTTTTTTTNPAPQATPATPVEPATPAVPASDQTAISQSAPADQSAISQQLIQRERDSWDNAKAGNVSYFSEGLAPNVSASLPNGSTESRNDLAEAVRKDRINDFNLSNFNVTFPSSDRAEVTYTASYSGHRKGGDKFNDNRQVTSEWQMDPNGNWQNVRVDFR